MGLLRPKNDKADSRFLLYAYLGPDFQQFIRERSIHGATVDRIPLVDLPGWPIRLPALPAQRAISGLLGALDDKIAVNDRITQKLDLLTREIFRHDFQHASLQELPHGWREGLLAEICTTQYGYTARSTEETVGPKLLRVKDINKKNWIEWDSVPYCEVSDSDRGRYSLAVGDILVARMADPGKSAIVESSVDAVFASYLVRLKTESLAHAYYVYGFLKSDDYADYAAASKSGSVQANMNAKVIVSARLAIPPVELLEAHLARILPLRHMLMSRLNESSSLAELRDTLLPKLMSGEIRVRDAEKVVEDVT
jgi:type I restriction enzyme S subunit